MIKYFIFLLILSNPVMAQIPWVAYGTVSIPPFDYVDNPACNVNGIFGEVVLPYIVPEGHRLIIMEILVE